MTQRDTVNILLVDDQPAKLLAYETVLSELGENLLKANSATEALELLLKHEIAVVLVDVCMPELDGYELASMIRQHPRFQQTSIIFVSAILMTDFDRLRGYECGAVDYVPVPVVPELLRAKVSVFADLYRKTRALERLNNELEARVGERTQALEATTEALREADRRKDEFIAVLAHELRNPLAPIRTAAQLLRQPGLSDSNGTRARDIIERQVEHLVRLIDDLMDVSRITRGTITLVREPVSLEAVVSEAVEVVRPKVAARLHDLSVSLPEEEVIVSGDATRLVQVVGNLLQNAVKFTEPGGRIALTVDRDGGDAVIVVTDTGVGIDAKILPNVFELFVQSDPEQSGLGVGLALVRRLAELHKGSVIVQSDGVGKGTSVSVRLPVLQTVPKLRQREAAARIPPPESLRILIADDNDDAATALGMHLKLVGHEVRIAHDGVEALSLGEVFKPQVVLLDLGMPNMNGFDAAREMRRQAWGATITLVALTGWGQPEDRRGTAAAGFDVHLVKPVDEATLFQVLSHCNGRGGVAHGVPPLGDRVGGTAP